MSPVVASLSFFTPPADGQPPYSHISDDPNSRFQNWDFVQHDVPIEDVRGLEENHSLDKNGFMWLHAPATDIDFIDEDAVRLTYYRECEALLMQITAAAQIVIFDHALRSHSTSVTPRNRRPISFVHVDATPSSAELRLRARIPQIDIPRLLSKRYQIINVWRPVRHTVYDCPLALCDYQSVSPATDFMSTTLIYPDHQKETYGVKYNPSHRWKYRSKMATDEVVVFKCFDSLYEDGVAALTPHAAFFDPTAPDGFPPRESIELRAFAFYD